MSDRVEVFNRRRTERVEVVLMVVVGEFVPLIVDGARGGGEDVEENETVEGRMTIANAVTPQDSQLRAIR